MSRHGRPQSHRLHRARACVSNSQPVRHGIHVAAPLAVTVALLAAQRQGLALDALGPKVRSPRSSACSRRSLPSAAPGARSDGGLASSAAAARARCAGARCMSPIRWRSSSRWTPPTNGGRSCRRIRTGSSPVHRSHPFAPCRRAGDARRPASGHRFHRRPCRLLRRKPGLGRRVAGSVPQLRRRYQRADGRTGAPTLAARRFFLQYADRIVFGTDAGPSVTAYQTYFRFLETDDEYFNYAGDEQPRQGRWAIYGLSLPDEVLRKVYYENAQRLIFARGRC